MSEVGFARRYEKKRVVETAMIAQAAIVDLDPQQLLLRDLFIEHELFPPDEADEFVRENGPKKSADLKERLLKVIRDYGYGKSPELKALLKEKLPSKS